MHFIFVFNNNNMTEKAVSEAQFNKRKKERMIKFLASKKWKGTKKKKKSHLHIKLPIKYIMRIQMYMHKAYCCLLKLHFSCLLSTFKIMKGKKIFFSIFSHLIVILPLIPVMNQCFVWYGIRYECCATYWLKFNCFEIFKDDFMEMNVKL